MQSDNPTAAHHHIANGIWTIYQMIMKHPQHGSLKGIPTLKLAAGLQGKFMKAHFWHCGLGWRSSIYLLFLTVPVHSCMDFFYNSAAEPDRELMKC